MNDRKQLSMLVMETDQGISIELYAAEAKALETFEQLAGKPYDKPSRATFLTLDWEKGGVTCFKAKDLPVLPDPDAEPWGHRLGVGPIDEPEKEIPG